MNTDDRAIGGFFEDLPVLMIVLMGTVSVMGTGIWVSEQTESLDRADSLDKAAEEMTDVVLSRLSEGGLTRITLDSIAALQPSSIVPDDGSLAWTVSIAMIHPWHEVITVMRSEDLGQASVTGWHSRLFNVLHGVSSIGVAEVVAVVSAGAV